MIIKFIIHLTLYYIWLYKEVLRVVKEVNDFQLIIKGHPSDYSGHKRREKNAEKDRPSWTKLAPDVPVCKIEDAYSCYHFCDVGITTISSVILEFPIFRKPVILVNSQEMLLPYKIADIVKIPRKIMREGKLRPWKISNNVMKIAELGVTMPTNYTNKERFESGEMEYIGVECHVDN